MGQRPRLNPANNSLFLVGHVNDHSDRRDLDPAHREELQDQRPEYGFDCPALLARFSPSCPNGHWIVVQHWGLEVVNSQLVGTFYEYYDGNTNAIDSHFKSSSLNLATASYRGLDQVGNLGGGFVGGYMTAVPPEWQAPGCAVPDRAGSLVDHRTYVGRASRLWL